MPGELWTEVRNTVPKAVTETTPKKKKCKKESGCPGGFSKRSERQRRKRERHSQLNAEFQRRARRGKKAFLSDQRKEIEENNRMGRPRDLFKKIRDTKGTFHAKLGTIKDKKTVWA